MSKDKKKKLKKALTKTARITFGVIAAIVAIITIVLIAYAVSWLKNGENTTASIVLLIIGAGGIFIVYKIVIKIKDSLFKEKMDKKFGDKRNASTATLTSESTKNMSDDEKAYAVCDAYRGESGGNSDADYRITSVDFSSNGGSVRFNVEIEVTTSWQPGADKAEYQAKGRAYANEVESTLKREITSKANSIGLHGVSVNVKSTVS